MKKTLALFLTLTMLVACSGAVASAMDLSEITPEDVNKNLYESHTEKALFDDADVATTDKVTDGDGVLTIETDYGLVFSYKQMEDVDYLTQDIQHDLLTYLSCYNNPVEEVQKFIENEMHLNLFTTTDQCLDIFFYAYEDTSTLSEIVGNANVLTDEDAEAVAKVLTSAYEINFEYGMVGDQFWFIGDLLESNNMLLGITFIGGHEVDAAIYNIASDADIDTVMGMLASVTLSTSK